MSKSRAYSHEEIRQLRDVQRDRDRVSRYARVRTASSLQAGMSIANHKRHYKPRRPHEALDYVVATET